MQSDLRIHILGKYTTEAQRKCSKVSDHFQLLPQVGSPVLMLGR